MLFVPERRRSRPLRSAIRARDVRAADLQEDPTKPTEKELTLRESRFVGLDEGVAPRRTSQRAQRAIRHSERGERSNQHTNRGGAGVVPELPSVG
jgi:hypothetical protein